MDSHHSFMSIGNIASADNYSHDSQANIDRLVTQYNIRCPGVVQRARKVYSEV